MVFGRMMLDHPGWVQAGDGVVHRAVTDGHHTTIVTDTRVAEVWLRVGEFDPAALAGADDMLVGLKAAGVVTRVANPSLWDALATAIVRQVIRAGQARKLYLLFSRAYGQPIDHGGTTAWLFPEPQKILALPDHAFSELGVAFKRPALQAAARAYLEHGEAWTAMATSPSDRLALIDALQVVPRIGPWTAGAAVADFTNDFSVYPYADLAVRTWARRLSPERMWDDDEPGFAAQWQELAGNQLSAWTLLTLAWGVSNAELTRTAPS
ncbi:MULTISPECIES: hypothetical protein [Nocardia]|uniref:DNA-3-methyladenine glycosylase 2 family protein n=1 Tax=Nocardia sputorum TaxID=2984338 RepID=A0ABN6U8V7_9NOCA|nr:hypothetical protein [Nocardia sputorum]BDU01727.1 hypothetical protein IFM12276_47550 [Nocardia sputorum]